MVRPLKPGDAVPSECTPVDNLFIGALANEDDVLREVAGAGVTAKGKLLLSSRKQDYKDAFLAKGLTICDDNPAHPFDTASAPLRLSLQGGQTDSRVCICGFNHWQMNSLTLGGVQPDDMLIAKTAENSTRGLKTIVYLQAYDQSDGQGDAGLGYYSFNGTPYPRLAAWQGYTVTEDVPGTVASYLAGDVVTDNNGRSISLDGTGLLIFNSNYFATYVVEGVIFDQSEATAIALGAAAAKIKEFVRTGGSLIVYMELIDTLPPYGSGTYGIRANWLPVLFPGLTVPASTPVTTGITPVLTAAGNTAIPGWGAAFPGSAPALLFGTAAIAGTYPGLSAWLKDGSSVICLGGNPNF